jgi:hypothetical protein
MNYDCDMASKATCLTFELSSWEAVRWPNLRALDAKTEHSLWRLKMDSDRATLWLRESISDATWDSIEFLIGRV